MERDLFHGGSRFIWLPPYVQYNADEDGCQRRRRRRRSSECRTAASRPLTAKPSGTTPAGGETAAHVLALSFLVLNLRKIQCAILRLRAYLLVIFYPPPEKICGCSVDIK